MASRRRTRHLSPEDLAAIACAPADVSPTVLARELGRDYDAVKYALNVMRRAGGWYCELRLPPCIECGQIVIGPPRLKSHPACMRMRLTRWTREYRQRTRNTLPADDELEERRAIHLDVRRQYYRSLPEERRRTLTQQWHQRAMRDYAVTLESADRRGASWSADDDLYVWENLHVSARDVALALGRTSAAVIARRVKLRRQHELEPSPPKPMPR